jgi:DNA processing protein
LVSGLAHAGFSIWSGGAEGIDAAVHRAALEVGAKTVVVAPSGWERPYPAEHANLYEQIIEHGGAYLSLVPADCPAKQHHFFSRNALLVALSQGVIVVQAGLRSGARNTAKTARNLGRPLFSVPSCPWVHQGLGCNIEIALGARAIGSARDVIKHMAFFCGLGVATTDNTSRDEAVTPEEKGDRAQVASLGSTRHHRRKSAVRNKSDAQAELALTIPRADPRSLLNHAKSGDQEPRSELIGMLRTGARNVDELCQRTGWSAAAVQSELLRLTLEGALRVGRSGEIEIVTP